MGSESVYNNMHAYVQNLINECHLNYDNYSDLKSLELNIESTILINYVANIQSVIIKNNYVHRNDKNFTENLREAIISALPYKYAIDLRYYLTRFLSDKEIEEIFLNMDTVIALRDNKILSTFTQEKNSDVFAACESHNIKYFTHKDECIYNVKNKFELEKIGLKSYIDDNYDAFLNSNRDDVSLLFSNTDVTEERLEQFKEEYQHLLNKSINGRICYFEKLKLLKLKQYIDIIEDDRSTKLVYRKAL